MKSMLAKKVLLIVAALAALCLFAGCGNKCTVTFDTGGVTEIAAQKLEKGDRITQPQDPERAGYIFTGWTYENEPWSFVGYVVSGDMTLTANWLPVTYTITYNDTSIGSNPTSFTVESGDITLTAPERAGYIFDGWTWEGQTEPQMTATIPAGTHESKTFTAHWSFAAFEVSEFGVLAPNAEAKSSLPADLVIPAVFNGIAVTSISSWAFKGCTGLTSVTIPEGVTSIGYLAFFDCTGLTSITIPDSVTSIDGSAFSGCTKLSYNAYDNAKYLGNAQNPYVALIKASDTSITSCTIHADTKVICGSAFSGCPSLTSVTIPDSVRSIDDSAFSGCTGLTSVTIPEGVTSIGSYAFSGCTGLTSITIPDSVTSIDHSAFSGCTGLTSITIPDGVTSIGDYAFYNCTGLTSVTIGNGVTSIGYSAFSGCTGLTSVTIPDSVKSIGEGAFSYCTGLTSVTFTGTKAQWSAISKGSFWNLSTGYYVVHCTDGDIAK